MAVDAVAEIKSRLDIVEVIGGYVALQRSGTQHKGLCPFHAEKSPSFMVSQARQAWYCHGCSEGGDIFTFVERIEPCDFRQALELLADRAGVELEEPAARGGRSSGLKRKRALELNARAQAYYEHVLWSTQAGAAGRELLAERGLGEATVRGFGAGFAPAGGTGGDALLRYLTARGAVEVHEIVEAGLAHPARGGQARDRFRHRLVFPIRDERGSTLGFGARALGDAVPKYLNSPETAAYHKSAALFGIDRARHAISREHTAVVVEGYFDVIAAHAAGVQHTVASSGTALTREQVRHLGRLAAVVTLCFDTDEAGWGAASRAVDVLAAERVQGRICVLPDGVKDPDELVRRDPAAFVAAVAAAPPEWQVLLDRALAGAEGGSVDARRTGAEAAVALLGRIPEAATRELYLQQAARRLDLGAQSLAADLERLRRDAARRPPRVVVATPAATTPPPETAEPAAADVPMPRWEAYLGSIVVHRPALARQLTESMGLDIEQLTHPTVRQLIAVAQTADNGSFPMHRLGAADQRHAARLLMDDVPELDDRSDPDALAQAIAGCVQRVREASVMRSIELVRHELHRAKEEGRFADVDRLAAQLTDLAREAPVMRGRLRVG